MANESLKKSEAANVLRNAEIELVSSFHNQMEKLLNKKPYRKNHFGSISQLETFQMLTHLGLVPAHLSAYACLGNDRGGVRFMRRISKLENGVENLTFPLCKEMLFSTVDNIQQVAGKEVTVSRVENMTCICCRWHGRTECEDPEGPPENVRRSSTNDVTVVHDHRGLQNFFRFKYDGVDHPLLEMVTGREDCFKTVEKKKLPNHQTRKQNPDMKFEPEALVHLDVIPVTTWGHSVNDLIKWDHVDDDKWLEAELIVDDSLKHAFV